MNRTNITHAVAVLLVGFALGACERQPPAERQEVDPQQTTPARGPLEPVELVDVVETTPAYVIGISYPQSIDSYPLLAAELKRYADAAQAELMQAVSERPADASMLYDLSLSFTEVAQTPRVVAFAADGSSYTGGAHGVPLLARWVWLPQQREMLTAQALIPGDSGWAAVAGHVREELYSRLSQQLDAEERAPAERAAELESAGRMIDEGTAPVADNFSQFEPVIGPGGGIVALRFVFAPYQVAPYAAGVQSVRVPASVLLPHVAPEYRSLFAVPGPEGPRAAGGNGGLPLASEPRGGITSA